jgi:hypothetical protein
MAKPDESLIPLFFWLALLISINVEWIAMDIWLRRHGHEFLTTEIREILQSSGPWGLVISFMFFGTIGLMWFHFAYQRTL